MASATGTPAPAVDRTVQTTPLHPAPATDRASRSDADREALSHLTDPTVNSVDDAVASARQNAKSASAAHSQRSHREQTDVERDLRGLVDTDLFDPAARPSLASSSDDSADSDSAGPLRPTPAGMSSAGGSFLLGLLPLPDDSIDTMIPGSLTARPGLQPGPAGRALQPPRVRPLGRPGPPLEVKTERRCMSRR